MKISEKHVQALQLMELEDFSAAGEILGGVVAGRAKEWIVKNDLALCEFMSGRDEAAIRLLEEITAADPENSFARINRYYVEAAAMVKKQPPPDPLAKIREIRGKGPDRPLVSVIMPTYNRPELIRESVESVFCQTMPEWELIVVNDGGERALERTLDKYLRDPRFRYVLAEHGGLSSARNVGLALAKGKYLTQLDDDDIYYPEHLAVVLGAFRKDPQYQVVYTDFYRAYQEKHAEGWRTVKRVVDFSRDFSREELRFGNYIPVCNLTHHRESLSTVGYYNEHILRAMDWEYFIRLARRYEFRHVDQVTGEFRQKSDRSQMTRSFEIPRNYYRNLVSFIHGFFPLTGRCFLAGKQGSGERLLRALQNLMAGKDDEFFIQRLELRKLLAEPYYALFYTLGKRVAEEGDPARARRAFLAAIKLQPLEPRSWMRLLRLIT